MFFTKVVYTTIVAAALCLPAAYAAPQDEPGHGTTAGKKTTVTGCLQKGDEANEYKIVASDGKTYGLTSAGSVNFAEHVGHKVTVTGTSTSAPKESAGEAKNEQKEGSKEESTHLSVTSLKHISPTCP